MQELSYSSYPSYPWLVRHRQSTIEAGEPGEVGEAGELLGEERNNVVSGHMICLGIHVTT